MYKNHCYILSVKLTPSLIKPPQFTINVDMSAIGPVANMAEKHSHVFHNGDNVLNSSRNFLKSS